MGLPQRSSEAPTRRPVALLMKEVLGVGRARRRPTPLPDREPSSGDTANIRDPHIPHEGATRRTRAPRTIKANVVISRGTIREPSQPIPPKLVQERLPGARGSRPARTDPYTTSRRTRAEELLTKGIVPAIAPPPQSASERAVRFYRSLDFSLLLW